MLMETIYRHVYKHDNIEKLYEKLSDCQVNGRNNLGETQNKQKANQVKIVQNIAPR